MAAANVFKVVLITGITSLFSNCDTDCFWNPYSKDSASENLQKNDAVKVLLTAKPEMKYPGTPSIFLPKPIKRSGQTILVDLLDYMNKSKPKAEDFTPTVGSRKKSTAKKGVWETMLYDEK